VPPSDDPQECELPLGNAARVINHARHRSSDPHLCAAAGIEVRVTAHFDPFVRRPGETRSSAAREIGTSADLTASNASPTLTESSRARRTLGDIVPDTPRTNRYQPAERPDHSPTVGNLLECNRATAAALVGGSSRVAPHALGVQASDRRVNRSEQVSSVR